MHVTDAFNEGEQVQKTVGEGKVLGGGVGELFHASQSCMGQLAKY